MNFLVRERELKRNWQKDNLFLNQFTKAKRIKKPEQVIVQAFLIEVLPFIFFNTDVYITYSSSLNIKHFTLDVYAI